MSQEMRRFLFSAGVGGAALGVSSQIPLLGCACCLFAIGAGYLAAYLYMKDQPLAAQAPYGEGALLGITTGFVGAAVATLISIPVHLLMGTLGMGGGLDQAMEALEDADVPPEVVDLISRFGGAGFSLVATLFSFVLYIVLFVTFALVGAVIGVAVLHKKPA